MSTNYYFIPTNKEVLQAQKNEVVQTLFDQFKEKLITSGFCAEKVEASIGSIRHHFYREVEPIHIGKRSLGWRPLFQANDQFDSMETLKEWYDTHGAIYHIENEYGEHLTWEQLEEELFQWSGRSFLSTEHASFYYKDNHGQEWTHNEFS